MKLTFDTRPRYGHTHSSSASRAIWTKITYMAHAKGYVMARRPGCEPFILTENQWAAFPFYDEHRRITPAGRSALEQSEPQP